MRREAWRRAGGRLVSPRVRHPRFLIRWGTLRRAYLSDGSPRDREGTSVSRYYGERFLRHQAGDPGYVAGDLRGRIVDVGEERFTSWLGIDPNRVAYANTVDAIDATQPDGCDCLLVGSALVYCLDLEEAIRRLYRALRPGGVVLALVPGIARHPDRHSPVWGLTNLAARRAFESAFPPAEITVQSFGNVLTATALLHRVPTEKLTRQDLELHDPEYPVVIAVRACKSAGRERALIEESGAGAPVQMRRRRARRTAIGRSTRLGSFRSPLPFSRSYGGDRGGALDRCYIENFLGAHAADVQGRVLEFGHSTYARRFARGDLHVDVADPDPNHPGATVAIDLASADAIATEGYDCVICTQVLLLVYDVRNALVRLSELLRTGGVLLLTVPGISQVCRPDIDLWGDYWRFSPPLMRDLVEDVFPPENVDVESYGNLLSATGFLYGLGRHELRREDVTRHDPDYTVIVGVRALKDGG